MINHPAKFSKQLIPVMAKMLIGSERILDPFAGVGGIFALNEYLKSTFIWALEIEPEWAACDSRIRVGNALDLPFADAAFDAVATSPCYGNRMSDQLLSFPRQRNTYADCLRRKCSAESSARLQWGKEYQDFHRAAWLEVKRVLTPSGFFVLNIKDHVRTVPVSKIDQYMHPLELPGNSDNPMARFAIKDGKAQCRVHVTQWHINTLEELGFFVVDSQNVLCSGNRQGQNGNARIPYETVIKFGVF